MWRLSPASRTQEVVDDRLVSVPWWRVHKIAMCAALVFFPHFRRYTRRLRTCRSSLSLSQLGRAMRGGCALLLPNVKRINMIRGERVFWFVWNRRLDGGGGSLSLNGEIGQISSSAIVMPYWSPWRRPIFPYWWPLTTDHLRNSVFT